MGLFKKFFKNKVETDNAYLVKREHWDFYTYTYDEGLRALIDFDLEHALEDEHSHFYHCVRLVFYIPPENCAENGLPFKEENEQLFMLESDLLKKLNVDCRFVGQL